MGLSLEFTTVSVKIIMYYIKTYSIFKSARDNSPFLRWAPPLYVASFLCSFVPLSVRDRKLYSAICLLPQPFQIGYILDIM